MIFNQHPDVQVHFSDGSNAIYRQTRKPFEFYEEPTGLVFLYSDGADYVAYSGINQYSQSFGSVR